LVAGVGHTRKASLTDHQHQTLTLLLPHCALSIFYCLPDMLLRGHGVECKHWTDGHCTHGATVASVSVYKLGVAYV
jgi:hypothetical protein